jgi:Transmembrane secretion effector
VTVVPLWRNRDFALLQVGQLLSSAGTQSTTIAYPLLVLAITGSPAQAGLVTFARLIPFGIFALPAGLAADRWNRKRQMIVADAVRAVAMAALAGVIATGRASALAVLLIAFVEGSGTTFFSAAQAGAMRGVVSLRQLPAAVGAQEARRAVVGLAGPPLGGALYGLSRSLPFLVDSVSYVFSTLSLIAMRTPFQEARLSDAATLRAQMTEGFRFLWGHAFLRTTALVYGIGNLLAPAMLLVVVVAGRRQGLNSLEIGLVSAAVGAGALVGSLASPLFRRALGVRAILLMELWTWLGSWVFVIWPNVYLLTAVLIPFGIAAPVTDSVVVGYRIAMTPDRLLGRAESVRSSVSLLLAPLGPLAAGLLLEFASTRLTVAVFAVVGLALALWGTFSRAIRNAPSLDDLPAST